MPVITTNRYASYMLRFQRVMNDQEPTWLISMQCTRTNELHRFNNLDAFITFLHSEFDLGQEEKLEEIMPPLTSINE